MRIWIIRDLEPIPIDPGGPRLMRAGMLAATLSRLGHQTRWITSSFDHYKKRQRDQVCGEIALDRNLTLTILPGPGYRHNLSPERIRHNRVFARGFELFAGRTAERPDVLVTDIPSTEQAAKVVELGRTRGIPTVLSIRDLWPDFFSAFLPAWQRPIAQPAISLLDSQARFACAHATSLVGISQGYLDWGLGKARRPEGANDCVIPLGYGAQPHQSDAADRAFLDRLGVREGARLVAFIGSWGRTYDLDLLLKTVQLLAGRDDIQFLIAGTGDQSARLRALLALLPNTLLPGWIDADQIGAVLRRADVGLLPYRTNAPQGLPNKVFEYFAYGAYQLATLGGELDAFYRESGAGRVVANATPRAFATAIVDALADPDIALEREARIAHFKAHYEADVVYRQLAAHVLSMARVEEPCPV